MTSGSADSSPSQVKPSSNGTEPRLVDLTRPIEKDSEVRILTERDPEALEVFRHSSAHLLAAAVRQAAVVGEHLVGPEPFGQLVGQPLGELPGVDEQQRALVLVNQFHQAVVDFRPVLM